MAGTESRQPRQLLSVQQPPEGQTQERREHRSRSREAASPSGAEQEVNTSQKQEVERKIQ